MIIISEKQMMMMMDHKKRRQNYKDKQEKQMKPRGKGREDDVRVLCCVSGLLKPVDALLFDFKVFSLTE